MTKWIEANGVSLRYALSGQGSETVVLVHEMGGMLESWDETLPSLEQNFRTLRYDQRGFGQSEKVRGKVTLGDMVGDIAGLLDGLGVREPCHLVASALGTSFAIAFAARHPARVARLAIASPVVTGYAGAHRDAMELRASTIEREGMRSYVTQSLKNSYPEVLRGNRARFETFQARWLANDPWCFAALNRMTADLDLIPELANIACPTLVLGAMHDTQRPPAMAKSIAGKIRGAQYVEVESGHFMAVETPDLFAQHVVPFLQGIGSVA